MAAELLKRLFLSEITEALRPGNEFWAYSQRDDAFVNNNSVELPHAGTDPTIAIDRSTFPGTIAQRTDAATQYVLEELSSDPTHLQFSEALVVAYAKRASILSQHVAALRQKMGDRAVAKWVAGIGAGATANIPTTGTGHTVATRTTDAPGSTDTVYKLAKEDILAGKLVLDGDDVPMEGRKMLCPPSMYNDLLALDEFTRADAYGQSNIPSGWVGRIFGFDVMVRSRVAVYDGSDAPKDTEAATAATDTHAAVLWHPMAVRTAVGAIKVFMDMDNPAYYGDIFSAAVRFGALEARNDDKGIVVIREDAN